MNCTGTFSMCSAVFSRSVKWLSASAKMPKPRSAWGIAGMIGNSPSAG